MSRYIRIDDLEQYILSQVINGVINIQKLKTADVVEVVRCKECENWDMNWISSTFTENAHHCVVLDNVFDGEFYCACGHRRRSF